VQRRRIAGYLRFALQAFPLRQNCDSVIAQCSADKDRVAGLRLISRQEDSIAHAANPGGVDEDAVGASSLYNFGITSNYLDAGIRSSFLHRSNNPPQRIDWQSFFQNKRSAHPQRPCTAHRQVVNRAVHCKRANISATEEKRLYHERIRGNRQPRSIHRDNRLIFQAFQHGIAERGEKNIV
jgi:hypothetical protein